MRINVWLLVAQGVIVGLVYAVPMFLPAGLRAWPAAWLFLGLWFGFWLLMLTWLARHNPSLLAERLRVSTADQKGWDRVFSLLINVTLFGWLTFVAFDAVRFHWSPVPAWLQALGAAVLLGAFYLFFLTFRENAYLSPVVRLQEERGQTVISTGPYGWVRHPMYAAMVAVVGGTPLLLGAWSGVLVGLVFVLVLARRAVLEERTLERELPGYVAYKARVRYRLVPHVW